jgi:S-methylmethionine-dependent homocysteine/selenocysteine methylase
MVKILTPAYGTALNYGSGIRVEAPLFAAAAYSNEYRRNALFHKTSEFLAMGIDTGRSIDGIATHTMRCSRNFIPQDKVDEFNSVAVDIARRARDNYGRKKDILIFGDMSVMGDCYSNASVAQSVDEAVSYHMEQARALVREGVDALWAETVGNLLEAKAFAIVAYELKIPVYISAVLDKAGNMLDGIPIETLVLDVDSSVPETSRPKGYLSNCSWETQVEAMYERAEATGVLHRMCGFYNNASKIDHDCKQQLNAVQRYESVEGYIQWIQKMLGRFPLLREKEDVWISGCCGFGADDIDQLIKRL